ncbi:hypothetical protein TWF281_004728 [Arthrobotrys megalospora]
MDPSATIRSLQKDIASLQNKYNELRDLCEGLVIICQSFDVENGRRKLDEGILSINSMSTICKEIRIDQMDLFVASNPEIAETYGIEPRVTISTQGDGAKTWWGDATIDLEVPYSERTHRLFEACYGITVKTARRYGQDTRLLNVLSQRCTLYQYLSDSFHECYQELCRVLVIGEDYEEYLDVLEKALEETHREA